MSKSPTELNKTTLDIKDPGKVTKGVERKTNPKPHAIKFGKLRPSINVDYKNQGNTEIHSSKFSNC